MTEQNHLSHDRKTEMAFQRTILWRLRLGCRNSSSMAMMSVILVLCILLYWKWTLKLGKPNIPDGFILEPGGLRRTHAQSLRAYNRKFYLDGREVTLLSGAMHYFRVVPEYWRHRMQLMKAAGLNTLETYIAWNMHEEVQGQFDFEGIRNIRAYIQTAAEEGLHVIVRPGPYICAEWEFGGLPSWLLSDPKMKVRSRYTGFIEPVRTFFHELAKQISDLQHHRGGPIIAFQVENEYGSYGSDTKYMKEILKSLYVNNLRELYFISDNKGGLENMMLPGVLATANFQIFKSAKTAFQTIRAVQPEAPLFAAEFWAGWFDRWGSSHSDVSVEDVGSNLRLLVDYGASVNLYMFHGGTNFGFMNGALPPSIPITTSYDYDAAISESGNITRKFHKIRQILSEKFKMKLPNPPSLNPTKSYGELKMTDFISMETILDYVKPVRTHTVVTMEMVNINGGSGQAYGFILYRQRNVTGSRLKLRGSVRDMGIVFLNGAASYIVDWKSVNPTFVLDRSPIQKSGGILDILVENTGRVNYARPGYENTLNLQRKGIVGQFSVDKKPLTDWEIYPLEFKEDFVNGLLRDASWEDVKQLNDPRSPTFLRAVLEVSEVKDTFVDMEGWTKGQVFINGFNLGRYWEDGPQRTLYLPAPLLKKGKNEIAIFELHKPPRPPRVTFSDRPFFSGQIIWN